MEGFFRPMPDCPAEESCLKWVQRYLLDCVCSRRDRFSLALGLMSVASWGVAEIPQILTNFREKSTEGVSLLFLTTWVIGDVFNLMGCYLEPATLPTQFLMAILYTVTTIVLVLQVLYYEHLLGWWKKRTVEALFPEILKADMESPKPFLLPAPAPAPPPGGTATAPPASQPTFIQVPPHLHPRGSSPGSREPLFIQSARSLARSYAHPTGSYNYVPAVRGSTGDLHHHRHSGSYLLTAEDAADAGPPESRPPLPRGSSPSLASSALRTMMSGVLVVGSLGLSLYASPRAAGGTTMGTTHSGRDNWLGNPFLQEEPSPLGEAFGWIMAAIYMGGRLPQIWLNIKRGTVEGLNPLMFAFALLGNASYVGSILVRSTDWPQLKPNLAWLVDAAVCVVLDIFFPTQILGQFGYYSSKEKQGASPPSPSPEEDDDDEEAAGAGPYKPLN